MVTAYGLVMRRERKIKAARIWAKSSPLRRSIPSTDFRKIVGKKFSLRPSDVTEALYN